MMQHKLVTAWFIRATMNVNVNPLTVHLILYKNADWLVTQLSHSTLSAANIIYNWKRYALKTVRDEVGCDNTLPQSPKFLQIQHNMPIHSQKLSVNINHTTNKTHEKDILCIMHFYKNSPKTGYCWGHVAMNSMYSEDCKSRKKIKQYKS